MEYTREGDQLNAECPEKFRGVLGHRDDKGKVDLIQAYLGADKTIVTNTDAKKAVGKAYQRFGEKELKFEEYIITTTYHEDTNLA